jgi:hypothetical protein
MPAAVAPDPGDPDAERAGTARVDDAVTQPSGTPLPEEDDDQPPTPPGHRGPRRG